MKKKIIISMVLLGILSTSGCNIQITGTDNHSAAETTEIVEKQATKEEEAAYKKSSAENDTDIGLRNVIIDNANTEWTEDQKELIRYFDSDYFSYDKEFFERYSKYFVGCQIYTEVSVKKIISSKDGAYTFIATDTSHHNDGADLETPIMYVNCPTLDIGLMEGDDVVVYGIFKGMESKEVDGTTYNLASVEGYSKTHMSYSNSNTGEVVYSYNQVKDFAHTMFGQDIKIDKSDDTLYKITFENQANANFNNVTMIALVDNFFDSYGENNRIWAEDSDENTYNIIVSSDFEHFYYFDTNESTNQTTIAYYDKDFKKQWQREFEGTESLAYDYTKNNFYLAINNNLYIINSETGEDTYSPTYVGKQIDVRKSADGIYLIKDGGGANNDVKADVLMKCDLTGKIIWSASMESNYNGETDFQILDGNILFGYDSIDFAYNKYFGVVAVIDADSGDIIQSCEKITTNGYFYSDDYYSYKQDIE
jgi:hypothetical protein